MATAPSAAPTCPPSPLSTPSSSPGQASTCPRAPSGYVCPSLPSLHASLPRGPHEAGGRRVRRRLGAGSCREGLALSPDPLPTGECGRRQPSRAGKGVRPRSGEDGPEGQRAHLLHGGLQRGWARCAAPAWACPGRGRRGGACPGRDHRGGACSGRGRRNQLPGHSSRTRLSLTHRRPHLR